MINLQKHLDKRLSLLSTGKISANKIKKDLRESGLLSKDGKVKNLTFAD